MVTNKSGTQGLGPSKFLLTKTHEDAKESLQK